MRLSSILQTVKLDQGACGHNCVKPTTLLTDLEAMKDLDGLRANGAKKEMHGGEPRSSHATDLNVVCMGTRPCEGHPTCHHEASGRGVSNEEVLH